MVHDSQHSAAENEKDEPNKWIVVAVTILLALLCFSFVMISDSFQHHAHQNPTPHSSFNETLKKDKDDDPAQSQARRVFISYATGIIGFVVGILAGACIGVLCCSRLFDLHGSSESSEKQPLISKSDKDKLRVV